MKKFIKGMPDVDVRISRYEDSLLRKYKITPERARQASLIILDGVVVKDRHLRNNISSMDKVIIGGATPLGEGRIYSSF